MAWLGLDRLFLGTSLDEAQTRSDELDRQIQDANRRLEALGYVPAGYADLASIDMAAGNASTGADNVVGSVNSEAIAGAQQGLHNVLAVPGQVIGAAGSLSGELLWQTIKRIPWWVWLGAAAALFIWLGGLSLLRGRLKRA